jgi:hypothetical protein
MSVIKAQPKAKRETLRVSGLNRVEGYGDHVYVEVELRGRCWDTWEPREFVAAIFDAYPYEVELAYVYRGYDLSSKRWKVFAVYRVENTYMVR